MQFHKLVKFCDSGKFVEKTKFEVFCGNEHKFVKFTPVSQTCEFRRDVKVKFRERNKISVVVTSAEDFVTNLKSLKKFVDGE